MGISVKTRKKLWGKSANRCAMPNCRKELVIDEEETDASSIIGEECHIVAKEIDGPRGHSDYDREIRDEYENLILMCRNHHKIIDDQVEKYSVEKLLEIKQNHEEWVNQSLNINENRLRDELTYSSYVDEWVKRLDLDSWDGWTSYLLTADKPSISKRKFNELQDLLDWMFNRIMPKTYKGLEDSWVNFTKVLQALLDTFSVHSIKINGWYQTERFYKSGGWNDNYDELLKEYNFHVDLIADLTAELTRAANYVCDQVRGYLFSDFRITQGVLVIISGPYSDFTFKKFKPQYRDGEKRGIPFTSLQTFKANRKLRDFNFGEEIS